MNKIYYESKLQYYIFALLLVLAMLILTILYPNLYYFIIISLLILLGVFLYKTTEIYIYEDKIIVKKGKSKIENKWSEIVGIHFDWAPSDIIFNGIRRGFKSNGFFIEIRGGIFSKYIDVSTIKVKGQYTFKNRGEELVQEIENKSQVKRSVGKVSILEQKQKLRDWITPIMLIILIPIIIITIYSLYIHFFGSSTDKELFKLF